jgi:4-amino-4-deoxy-L-arabinose transferase-like glycosyltransferase
MWRRLVGTITSHPDLVAVLAIGLVAAILRLAFLYRAPVFLTGDSQSHYLPGYDLALGLGFDPELRRTPGYPVFVAGVVTFLGEDLRALAFAQHLLGTATALLTYWLGRVTVGRAAGAVAGLLVALNGALILSEHSVMTEALFGSLLVAALAALAVAIRGGRWPWFLLGGCLLGVAALTRPVAQILLPLVPLVVLILERRWRPALRASILVGLGFLLLVGPWMARNLIEHGSLTAAGGLGRSLVARTVKYDFGYFQEDRPTADPDDLAGQTWQFIRGKRNTIRNSRSVRSTQSGLMEELNLTQAQADQLMRQAALEEIAARPGYYVVGSLRMAGQIAVGKEKEDALLTRWTQRTDKDWVEQWEARVDHLVAPDSPAEQHEQARAEALVGIFQPAALGPILPALALIGLLAAAALPRARTGLLPGLAALALILASAALDGPVPRYRYPVDPLIALLAAGGALAAVGGLAAGLRRIGGPRPRQSRVRARDARYAGELNA